MPAVELPSPVCAPSPRRSGLLAGLGLVLAAVAVYWNSLDVPFLFDDQPGIVRNTTIRHLWPLWDALNPTADGSGTSGRPLVNLSFAVNYALGGLEVCGYHVMNLALHILTTLTLWGVLGRTLRLALPEQNITRAIGWCVALIWCVHPLLTESVVCAVQRNEIMGSLFYLLTVYCFIRGADAGPRWFVFSFLACLAGVASKETVSTAPLLVLLYDRTFVAGSFRAAWQRRGKYYGALAATWILLAWLVWQNRQRGGTVGFGTGVSSWEYLLTQCRAIVLYLKLSVWPHPLVMDYGMTLVKHVGEVWWQGLVVLSLLAGTVVALWRRPAVGFVGAWFFVLLAPSSSFVPLATQTIAEHRMYLPLVAPVTVAVLALAAWLGRRGLWLAVLLAVGLGGLTIQRNRDYRSDLEIWTDTVAKCPGNARAHGNLGRAYLVLERWEEALAKCQDELRMNPAGNGDARVNIGRALTGLGRPKEALPYFEEGLRLKSDGFDARNKYGIALAALGRWPEAIAQYEAGLRLQPDFAELHNNLANALVKAGRLPEALAHYEAAVKFQPDFVDAEVNWARALAEAGSVAAALPHFEKVLQARPDAAAHQDLAMALVAAGRAEEAIPHFEAALKLEPNNAATHFALGNLFAQLGRFAEAIAQFQAVVRLDPAVAEAQHNLAVALTAAGRAEEAIPYYEATLRLRPDSAGTHHELALVLGQLRRWTEAAAQDEAALRLQPDFAEAREHLAWLRQQ